MATFTFDLSCTGCCNRTVCCCPDNPLPNELTLEVFDASSNSVAVVDVAYNATTERWESAAFSTGSGCNVTTMWFKCFEEFCQWDAGIIFDGSPTSNAVLRISSVCDPLALTWRMESPGCLQLFTFVFT